MQILIVPTCYVGWMWLNATWEENITGFISFKEWKCCVYFYKTLSVLCLFFFFLMWLHKRLGMVENSFFMPFMVIFRDSVSFCWSHGQG